jgi:hypothetical protein
MQTADVAGVDGGREGQRTILEEDGMQRAVRLMGATLALAVLTAAAPAVAQRQYPGKNELSGHLGGSVGLADFTPGGFKWASEYGYRLGPIAWLNLQLNFSFGEGGGYYANDAGDCWFDGRRWHCYGHWEGNAIELVGGVKLKFGRDKLQPYAKIGGGFVFTFFPGDLNAAAIVFRGGGGVKYFVLRNLAVGGELMLSVGPNFVGQEIGTEAYAALDFLGGVEFIF